MVIISCIELITNCNPNITIIIETIKPEIYSIRAWPKGWSLSAGLFDNLNPTKETIELPASVKLLTPSATREITLKIKPKTNFKMQIKIFFFLLLR